MKPPKHLSLVPTPRCDFSQAGEVQAREAAERLAAVTLLSYYDKSRETRQALHAARSAMVPFRLTRRDMDLIEHEVALALATYFLEG